MGFIFSIIISILLSVIVGIAWAGAIARTNPKEWQSELEADDES